MKKISTTIFLTFLICINLQLYSQIVANAGNDIVICRGQTNLDSLTIGSNPTAVGGYPPYKYIWYGSLTVGNKTYSASYYLSDTSSANPKFIRIPGGFNFNLMVIDSLGNFAFDDIHVKHSDFGMNLSQKFYNITKGQSVTLYTSVGGGWKPYNYLWSPNYKISNIKAELPIVTPDTTTIYSLAIIDSAGCIAPVDYFPVYVNTTSINKATKNIETIEIVPNPLIDHASIFSSRLISGNSKLTIIDYLGREIKTFENFNNSKFIIHKNDFTNGFYSFLVFDNNAVIGQGKFIVN